MSQFDPTFLDTCRCRCQNLERVTVERPGRTPYVTDFLSCLQCKVMYHSPPPRTGETYHSTQSIMDDVHRLNLIPKPRKR